MSVHLDDLASCLIVGLAGPALAPAERRWLERWQPAGVILFARNCEDAASWRRLTDELRAVLPDRAELCADHEGGPVSFLQAVAGRPPAARTLGLLDDPDLTLRVHRETGRRLRALNLDRVLAPCCDVLSIVQNPVIGARAFGDDSDLVARHVRSAMAGLREADLSGCAKHWPGHGATAVDTHDGAAAAIAAAGSFSVDHAAPFTAAVAAGADMVMLGHLPAGAGRLPATLDPPAISAARSRFGPAVKLVSDDITMGALRPGLLTRGIAAGDGRDGGLVDPACLPVAWLEALFAAGSDRLLIRGIPWRALPLPDSEPGPALPCVPRPCDLIRTGPAAPVYAEARRLAVAGIALQPGPERLLWVDATAGDRLGEAASLRPLLERPWPHLERVDADADRHAPGEPAGLLLLTSHRPLTVAQATLVRALAAPRGQGLAAGHPSLQGDLERLLGADWRIDSLADLAAVDLLPLAGSI